MKSVKDNFIKMVKLEIDGENCMNYQINTSYEISAMLIILNWRIVDIRNISNIDLL